MTTPPPTTPPDALICLLSDQPMPNLLPVHHFRPKQLVLVETTGMKKRNAAENFLAALRLGKLDYSLPERHRVYPLEEQASFPDCAELFETIARDLEVTRHNVIVNLTGGTKVMSIAAHEVFGTAGARLIYIDAATPGEFQHFPKDDRTPLEYRPGCDEFLRAYGFTIPALDDGEETRVSSLYEAARAFVKVAAHHHPYEWQDSPSDQEYEDERHQKLRKGKLVLEPGQLRLDPSVADPLGKAIANMSTSKASSPVKIEDGESGQYLVGKPDAELGRFLTGDWLDIFIARLLRRHSDNLKLWDVRHGIHFQSAKKDSREADNQIDVLFVRDYSLCAVECKTFMPDKQEFDVVNVVYKLDSVVGRIRALRTNTWIATLDLRVYKGDKQAPPRLDLEAPEPPLWDKLDKRLRSHQCRLLSPHLLSRLARADDDQTQIQLLYEVFTNERS